MTLIVNNYKRHDLFVDTGTNIQNETTPFENDNINENRINIQNNYIFKDFISSIMKIHAMTPIEIKIKMIALIIAFTMPQLFFDWLNIHTNINNLSDAYLLVAIIQKQTFSFIFCYYIVTEDLHNIYQFPNGNKDMTMLCKIDTYWCEYYSILGVTIVSRYYFINSWIDATNIYILFVSILKLAFIKYVIKKNKKD
jgi:hypothetical protein